MKAQGLTKETITLLDLKARDFPKFLVGDTIEVGQIIKEGDKERVQLFSGDVIAMHRNGLATTFTVRRIAANNVGVERIFPYYSPVISHIRVLKHGSVRRAKLFYLRQRIGKAAKIKEKIRIKEEKQRKMVASEAKQESVTEV